MEILVLRHVDCEHPAAYTDALSEVADLRTVRLGVDPLPGHTGFAAIVSMGGPMGVGDAEEIPWIPDEIDFIARAVAEGVPVWGVCLGAQLLAAALGGSVYRGAAPEVGIGMVNLTERGLADPVWGDLGPRFPVMQWHSDTFDIPEGAELLAGSARYPHQIFRHGTSYGVQFHVEAPAELAAEWLEIPEYRQSLEAAIGADGVEQFTVDHNAVEAALTEAAGQVMRRWLALAVSPEPAGGVSR
ncbi:glutamine amidotransferase [Nocardia farcinica]|nr:glutamine amidotransferase [Nocardia farcinica]